MYRIGVDLGGTNIAVGVVDEEYKIVARAVMKTNADRPADNVICDIRCAVETAMEKLGITKADCISIGIGAPGCCDVEKGVVIRSYSLSWNNVPLVEQMHKHFGLPVKVDNDANCAALAEVKAGAAKGFKNAVLVTLGTGIGSGIIINGKIYTGNKGSGTEIGHTMIDINGDLCSCGRKGCWDAYASATALIVQAKRAAMTRPESELNHVPITGKSVFDAAEHGDVTAIAVVRQYCYYLAVGVSNIVNIFGPEIILIGGGISHQGERILIPVRQYIRENCFDRREEVMPIIEIASMGNDAGIVGAAAL